MQFHDPKCKIPVRNLRSTYFGVKLPHLAQDGKWDGLVVLSVYVLARSIRFDGMQNRIESGFRTIKN